MNRDDPGMKLNPGVFGAFCSIVVPFGDVRHPVDHKGYIKCSTNIVTYSVIRSIERGEPVFDVCRVPRVHIPSCHHNGGIV
jgi:hypothetical protein